LKKTEPYSVTKYYNEPAICGEAAKIYSTTSSTSLGLTVMHGSSGHAPYSGYLNLKSNYFNQQDVLIEQISDTGLSLTRRDSSMISHIYYDYSLADKKFDHIQEIIIGENQRAASPSLWRLYIAKNKGLVAYETYPDSTLWIIK